MKTKPAVPGYDGPRKTALESIRMFCVGCMGGSFTLVAECPSVDCAFHAYRSGIIEAGASRRLLNATAVMASGTMISRVLGFLRAGLLVIVINTLLHEPLFSAATTALLGIAVGVLIGLAGVLRHPLDPIGQSPSAIFRLVYLLLLIPTIASMFLIAWRLAQRGGAK